MRDKPKALKVCVWIHPRTHKQLKKVAAAMGMKIQCAADQAMKSGLDFFEGKLRHGG